MREFGDTTSRHAADRDGGKLAGRTALITGAGSGIGRAIAQRFAQEGARVLASDLDLESAEATAEGIGAAARGLRLDVGAVAELESSLEHVLKGEPPLDILVNNAGTGIQKAFLETTPAELERIFRINVFGAFELGRLAARRMRAEMTRGRIVNIASVAGLSGCAGRAAYGASKAALINLTQVMALELGPHGITANAIAPGPVETEIVKRMHTAETRAAWLAHVPAARYGTVEEIAAAALYLASPEAAYTNGHVLAVDGGYAGTGLRFSLDAG